MACRTPASPCCSDLDRVKLVNDSAGHAAGDEMLVEADRRISTTPGEQTLVARLGGDEFAVLVEGVRDHVVADALATTLLEELGQHLCVAGRELFPFARLGIPQLAAHFRPGASIEQKA